MLKSKVSETAVNTWKYERHEFKSSVLAQDLHCGFLRPGNSVTVRRTVYMLHGGNADDTQLAQAGLLPHLAASLENQPVQIVFPNIGSSFLHDHPSDKSKSYSEYFLKEVLPASEAGTQSTERLICGWSMGGQAALSMFARHSDHFAGVGAHFPTLIQFNYLNANEAEAYAQRQNISKAMLDILVGEFKKEFVDLKDFHNHDPLTLARAKAPLWRNKKIYFNVGDEDEFGLSEGARALHTILQGIKIPHHFECVPQGKHDGAFIYGHIAQMLKYLL